MLGKYINILKLLPLNLQLLYQEIYVAVIGLILLLLKKKEKDKKKERVKTYLCRFKSKFNFNI